VSVHKKEATYKSFPFFIVQHGCYTAKGIPSRRRGIFGIIVANTGPVYTRQRAPSISKIELIKILSIYNYDIRKIPYVLEPIKNKTHPNGQVTLGDSENYG